MTQQTVQPVKPAISPEQIILAIKNMEKEQQEAFIEDLLATVSPEYLESIRSADEEDGIIQLMVKAGLVRPRRSKKLSPPDIVPEEERRKLAEKLGQTPGRLLSEIIISEREQ